MVWRTIQNQLSRIRSWHRLVTETIAKKRGQGAGTATHSDVECGPSLCNSEIRDMSCQDDSASIGVLEE